VRGHRIEDHMRKRHGANTRCGLGWRHVWRPTGDGDELSVDGHLPAQEVQPVDSQAEALTLPQPGAGRECHLCPQRFGHRNAERFDLIRGQRSHSRPVDLREPVDDTGAPFDAYCAMAFGDGIPNRDPVAPPRLTRSGGASMVTHRPEVAARSGMGPTRACDDPPKS